MYCEDFSVVLFPRLNGKFIETDIEELNGAITGGDEALVLVGLGPGEIEEGVLCVKP